jgi:hypothetical protein
LLSAGCYAARPIKAPTLPPRLTDTTPGTFRPLLYRHGGEWQPITGIIGLRGYDCRAKTPKTGRKNPEFSRLATFHYRQNRTAGLSLSLQREWLLRTFRMITILQQILLRCPSFRVHVPASLLLRTDRIIHAFIGKGALHVILAHNFQQNF